MRTKEQLKKITLPLLMFLLLGIVSMMLIPISIPLALVLIGVDFLALIFLLIIKLNDYKIKYVFLGKKYNLQLEEYCRTNNFKKNSYFIKMAKDTYRKKGYIIPPKITPEFEFNKLISLNNQLSISNGLLDLVILYELSLRMSSGSGLYGLFEYLNQYISYKDYDNVVSNSNYIDEDIKHLLLNKNFAVVYDLINHKDEISDDKNMFLEEFETSYSYFIEEDIELLNNNIETVAIELYIQNRLDKELHPNVVNAFYNKEKRTRLQIIKTSSGSYTAIKDIFYFENYNGVKEYTNMGYFSEEYENIGLYSFVEDLLKDYKHLVGSIENCIKIF